MVGDARDDQAETSAMIRRLAFVIAAISATLAACLACAGVAIAETGTPWWHLNVGARPSLLHAPAEGVQEVQAAANSEGLLVVKLEVEGVPVACLVNAASSAACAEFGLPADRTSAKLRASLEAVYGAGVQVSGGPTGSAAFVVKTPGKEAPPLVAVALRGTASVNQLAEGGSGRVLLVAYNIGDTPTSGPASVSALLPAGLTATRVVATGLEAGAFPEEGGDPGSKCTLTGAHGVSCGFSDVLQPYRRLEVVVWVTRSASAESGEQTVATVSGGGAEEASRSAAIAYQENLVPFGVETGTYEMEPEEEGGAPDTQAGSHPFAFTTTFRLNETGEQPFQPALPRNLRIDLPAGMVADVQSTPQCTYAQFLTLEAKGAAVIDKCPADTAVGVSMQQFVDGLPPESKFLVGPVPVFNLTPTHGEPARFGFEFAKVPVVLDTAVRTGGDYGAVTIVHNLTETAATGINSIVSLWGVPSDSRHERARGWECLEDGGQAGCAPPLASSLPFLSLPSACERFHSQMQIQSWQPGAELLPPVDSAFEGTLDGCNDLPFDARIEAAPDKQAASTPSGLTVNVHVPQEAALNAKGLTDADIRNMTVALPAGVSLNPGGGVGLQSCSESQIGYIGNEPGEPHRDLFTPGRPEPFCPDAAKIATVKITTPLLPNPLEGAVYLATPAPNGETGMNPFDSLVAIYVVAEDPVSGVLVKLPGKVVPCEQVGEVVGGLTCEAVGQLITPFEDAELHFFGDANAPLATPALCGSYQTKAIFSSWSGAAPVDSSSFFDITSGPGGSSCQNPRPFSPEFEAGTVNVQAGAFSELRTTIGHPDADQQLGGVTVKLAPGLSGLLSKVKLCGEPQAREGTCGPESLIGHTIVTAGLGSSPVVVKRPGNVYITGSYKGAPYGLSIANPAEAGPFDLEKGTACDCIVVRAKIEVDPITAQLTITSDPLPTTIKGIPLLLQHVQVAIDRPGFTFNPTSCNRMSIEGEMASSEGAAAPVSTPFQVTNCGALGFKPSFTVSTSGRTSRRNGASLQVKIAYPKGSMTSEANIHSVKVELPKKLPSRLQTLHEACLYTVFNANPANCPAASRVGFAKAVTPLLPVPLTGPAYFVSYGGAKFPELVIVLQGYGVTIDLHGETFINEKTSVTTSTFKTAPDQPIESFEITLPEGSHSALAANGNLCANTRVVTVKHRVTITTNGHRHTVMRRTRKRVAAPLLMPTIITAQDGAVIHQDTHVAVGGCTVHGRAGKAGKHHRHG